MTLHDPAVFDAFVRALPGTSLASQWEARVGKVGGQERGKVFCLLGDVGRHLVFRVSELAFEGLVELDGIGQAAYFAKRRWVDVAPGALDEALLAGYLGESHRLIAAGLTKKLRAELGIPT